MDASVPTWTSYGFGDQYTLTSADGQSQNSLTQQAYHGQWITLFPDHQYAANQDYTVQLNTADGADANCHYEMADQIRWVYDGAGPPPPTTSSTTSSTTTSTGPVTTPVNTSYAPMNEVPPKAGGDTVQGRSLSETHGTWAESPTTFSYQWERCDPEGNRCATIPGATGRTYTLTQADVGHTIAVAESAANAAGVGSPATSAATDPVLPALRAGRRLHNRIVAAANALLRQRGARVRITVTLSGEAAASIGVSPGTMLAGSGVVDFAKDRASWKLALPSQLGGGSLRVILNRTTSYFSLGRTDSIGAHPWIRVDPSQLAEVPKLGFVGSLAVLMDPREAAKLLGSSSPDVAQVLGSRLADDAADPSASAAGCSVAPGISTVQSALNPVHLVKVGKMWKKTYQDALDTGKEVRVVSKLGVNGRLAGVGLVDAEGLSILDDYCPDDNPTGIAAIRADVKQITDVKNWLTIDPCLVGTWQLVGPLENYPGNPIANGTTVLNILPDSQGTLTFAEIKIPLPPNPPIINIGVGSVVGTAVLTVYAPVSLSNEVHRLIWNVVTSDVTETSQGWFYPGIEPYYIESEFGPPVLIEGIPPATSPVTTDMLTPTVRQTSYDCSADNGTLSLALPFPGWKSFAVPFQRVSPEYKPSGS